MAAGTQTQVGLLEGQVFLTVKPPLQPHFFITTMTMFYDTGSFCSPGACYVDQDSLHSSLRAPPPSAFVLELKVLHPTPTPLLYFLNNFYSV